MAFDTNVFINGPFDDDYRQFLRPLLFTVIYVGLEPRIALEEQNSAEHRIEKIVRLVAESRLAIHDLSRIRAQESGEFFRLNMPFELGLDVGARRYGNAGLAQKRCLVIEAERFRYQAALSDIAGSDIAVYGNDPADLVVEIRNWLVSETRKRADGPALVWSRFNEFMADNYAELKSRGFSDKNLVRLPIAELMSAMAAWVVRYRGGIAGVNRGGAN